MPMQSVLAIDVAKGKSMVSLISSCGEVLIEPHEINHSINDLTNLLNKINKQKLDNVSVIMESTSIYHRPVERFFITVAKTNRATLPTDAATPIKMENIIWQARPT